MPKEAKERRHNTDKSLKKKEKKEKKEKALERAESVEAPLKVVDTPNYCKLGSVPEYPEHDEIILDTSLTNSYVLHKHSPWLLKDVEENGKMVTKATFLCFCNKSPIKSAKNGTLICAGGEGGECGYRFLEDLFLHLVKIGDIKSAEKSRPEFTWPICKTCRISKALICKNEKNYKGLNSIYFNCGCQWRAKCFLDMDYNNLALKNNWDVEKVAKYVVKHNAPSEKKSGGSAEIYVINMPE